MRYSHRIQRFALIMCVLMMCGVVTAQTVISESVIPDATGDGVPERLLVRPFGNLFVNANADADVDITGRLEVSDGRTGLLLMTLVGEAKGDAFGLSVSSRADFNGDGVHDLLVGAPYGAEGGRAYVFYGPFASNGEALSASEADLILASPSSTDRRFGHQVAPISDLDGDNLADIRVRASSLTSSGVRRSVTWIF